MDACHHGYRCLLLVSVGLFAGCITPDPSVDLLEGELRWMEDQLYMMEDQLQLRCQELVACRQNGAQHAVGSPITGEPTPATPIYAHEPEQNREIPDLIQSPAEPLPQTESKPAQPRRTPAETTPELPSEPDEADLDFDFDMDDLGEPKIELPAPVQPRGERPQLETPSAKVDDNSPAQEPAFLSQEVEQLRLNAARVSSHEHGKGAEKLLLVVEPQSDDNAYIEMSAPIKVSLLGPGSLSNPFPADDDDDNDDESDASDVSSDFLGNVSRVKTAIQEWEFSAVETGQTLRNSNMGQGIHLTLDWPPETPLEDDVRVVVSYTRLDGEQIHAERTIQAKQAKAVAGWVPVVREKNPANALNTPAADPPELKEPPPTADLFALVEYKQFEAGTTIQTVPISQTTPISSSLRSSPSSAVDAKSDNDATWTEPISTPTRTSDATTDVSPLTPIDDVTLESIEDRIFGAQTVCESTEAIEQSELGEQAALDERTGEIGATSAARPWTPYR